MASLPETESADCGAPAADAKTTAPTADETPEAAPSVQASGSATSTSNTSTNHSSNGTDTEKLSSPDQAAAEDDAPIAKSSEEDGKTEAPAGEQPAEKGPVDDAASPPPPLPDEPLPEEQETDDGWDPMWSDEHQGWYFYNRFTQQTQWDNPRVPVAEAEAATTATAAARVAGGYNPAIHGDYDPTAWYATGGIAPAEEEADAADSAAAIAAAAAAAAAVIQSTDPHSFRNSRTDMDFGGNGHRYSQAAKSSRQLNAYFDVASTSNEHDGRSLKAERSGKKPTKAELKAFKEKRRAKKEEKRRAWLRD